MFIHIFSRYSTPVIIITFGTGDSILHIAVEKTPALHCDRDSKQVQIWTRWVLKSFMSRKVKLSLCQGSGKSFWGMTALTCMKGSCHEKAWGVCLHLRRSRRGDSTVERAAYVGNQMQALEAQDCGYLFWGLWEEIVKLLRWCPSSLSFKIIPVESRLWLKEEQEQSDHLGTFSDCLRKQWWLGWRISGGSGKWTPLALWNWGNIAVVVKGTR